MTRKALINLISCVLSIVIIIGTGIFAFSKLYEKEKEIAPPQTQDVTEIETVSSRSSDEQETKPSDEKATQKQTKKNDSSSSSSGSEKVTSSSKKSDNGVSQTNSANKQSDSGTARKEAGTLGFLWDPIEEIFYSASDPWQRNFGYNALYDFAANYIVLYYDTLKVKFNYGGYDWLVQFWKGQYGFVLIGAEVGVYYKTEGSPVEHYFSSDDNMRLRIGYTCYDKGKVIFSRDYQNTWWLTGFVEGKLDAFNDRSEMAMDIRITLKSSEMRDAFIEGLENSGLKRGGASASDPDTYYTRGNDVYLYWQNVSN